jgi:uncharacterized metal-binding protein
LADEERIRPGQFEALCNPVGQAKLLSQAGTGLYMVVGLRVGHDSLCLWHSEAPGTVLMVRDRPRLSASSVRWRRWRVRWHEWWPLAGTAVHEDEAIRCEGSVCD